MHRLCYLVTISQLLYECIGSGCGWICSLLLNNTTCDNLLPVSNNGYSHQFHAGLSQSLVVLNISLGEWEDVLPAGVKFTLYFSVIRST